MQGPSLVRPDSSTEQESSTSTSELTEAAAVSRQWEECHLAAAATAKEQQPLLKVVDLGRGDGLEGKRKAPRQVSTIVTRSSIR